MMKTFLMCLALITVSQLSFANGPQRKIAQEAKVLVQDIVHKVVASGNAEKVMFRRHSGIYYLRNDSKHYEAIKKALEESMKTGDQVKVKADVDSMEIEELILETK